MKWYEKYMKTIHFLVNAAMPSVDASLLLH